jgi:hypothetical protein
MIRKKSVQRFSEKIMPNLELKRDDIALQANFMPDCRSGMPRGQAAQYPQTGNNVPQPAISLPLESWAEWGKTLPPDFEESDRGPERCRRRVPA